MRKMNWLGFAGGVSTICLIAVSLFVPWWVLTVGEGLVKANVSPIYTDFNFVGNTFAIPLLFALNLASILTMLAGGIAILIYSIRPDKSYSKRLLGFGYSKPFFAVIIFVVLLIVMQQIVKALVQIDIPILGSITSTLPQSQTQGASVTVLMSAELQWPFYLAIAVAALCLGARFYHKKIVSTNNVQSTSPPPSPTPATVP